MEAYFTINFRVSEYIKDVLRMMIEDEPLTPNEIVDKYEISLYMVNSLIKKGIFTKVTEKVNRIKDNSLLILFAGKAPKKTADENYRPLTTKYPEGYQI